MWISGKQKPTSPEKPAAVRRVTQENDVATTPASAPSPKKEEIKPTWEKETVVEDSRKDESMGGVLQEAAKMLRSLNASQGVKKVDERNDRSDDLQKQLNGLRSGSLKRAQVNAQGRWSDGGLLDSGATHPLRARQEGEDIENLMRITEGGIIVQENEGVGSIILLGLLVERLHCVVTWDGDECREVHPEL